MQCAPMNPEPPVTSTNSPAMTASRPQAMLHSVRSGASVQFLACSISRLFVAGHPGVPIGEAPLRVVLPRPDMQFKKGRKTVPVGRVDEVQKISLERGGAAPRVTMLPIARQNDELDSDQTHRTAR